METPAPPFNPPSGIRNTKSLPPIRGQIKAQIFESLANTIIKVLMANTIIKAQIFESLANTVAFLSSKAGEILGMPWCGDGSSTNGSSPPPSPDNLRQTSQVITGGGSSTNGSSPPPSPDNVRQTS